MKIIDYKIVWGDEYNFNEEMSSHIKEGWALYGTYSQIVMKEENKDILLFSHALVKHEPPCTGYANFSQYSHDKAPLDENS